MEWNSSARSAWRCVVKRRARQLERYHRIKQTPEYQLARLLRDIGRVRVDIRIR